MKTTPRRAASLALALVILGGAPLVLSGCSVVQGAVQHAVDQAAQQASSGDTGSDSGDTGSDSGSGDTGSDAGSGDTSDVKEVPLPSDLPADAPITSGKVIDAYSMKGSDTAVWSVTVLVSGVDALDGIESAVEGQGWTEAFKSKSSDQAAATFSKGDDTKNNITVAIDSDGPNGSWEAVYIITEALS